MRGRPLLEFLLLLAVWVFLFWPLWFVTRSGARETEDAVVAAAVRGPVWVQLHFMEAPTAFRLYSQGALVWEEISPEVEQEQPLELMWDADMHGDLVLVAAWEASARRVTEVRVAPPSGSARSVTLWHTDAKIEEPLLFR